MSASVFTLDENRRWFIEEGRIDPMTREGYKIGDRVVVCSDCNMVSLESTWLDCGGCTASGCGCKVASNRFLKAPPPKTQGPNQIVLKNGKIERQYEPSSEQNSGELAQMIIKARNFYN